MRKRLNKTVAMREKLDKFRVGQVPSNSKIPSVLNETKVDDVAAIAIYDPKALGRPPVIADPVVYTKIIDSIVQGNFLTVAAAVAGVSYDAVKDCLERGQRGENTLYYQFWLDVRQAEALSEQNLVQDIMSQTRIDWKAALELLKRRFPNWADKSTTTVRHEHSGTVVAKQEFALRISEDPVLRQQARNLLKDMGRVIDVTPTVEVLPIPTGEETE